MHGDNLNRVKRDNHSVGTHLGASIPSRLQTPPRSPISPPVVTREQELPLEKLLWEDFEKLCLRLARLEASVQYCRQYGIPGQKQAGIDIYARQKLSEKYRVYQCKRVNNFGPAKIKDAVSTFLEGEWATRTDTFVLCTKESLRSTKRAREVEAQCVRLNQKGITLQPWDREELSVKLKDSPRLVDDFFGREWVVRFCGEKKADALGKRLDRNKIVEFRKKFVAFYKHVFNTHDPGLPIATLGEAKLLSLEDRYVIPDVYLWHSIPTADSSQVAET